MPDPSIDRAPIGALALQHVTLPVADPVAAADWTARVAGLPAERHGAGVLRSRADAAAWRLAWTSRDAEPAIGVELADEAALDAATARLREAGFEAGDADAGTCEALSVARAAIARDASGHRIELVVRPRVRAQRFRPVADTGVCGLGPIGVRSLDVERDLAFWTHCLGARLADRVGDIAYLGLSDRHHDLALYPAARAGVLYATLEVDSFDSLMIDWYALQEAGIAVHHGPGREAASGQRFVRFAGPDGQLLAFGWGMDRGAAVARRPRRFELEPFALCTWGSRCTSVVELDPGQLVTAARDASRHPSHAVSGKVIA